MQIRNLLGMLLSVAVLILSGCGGGGGGGGGGGPTLTDGAIASTSATITSSTYPTGQAFGTTVNHAYSVELAPTGSGDPDLLVTDASDPAYASNFMDWSMNWNPDIDVVSFIGDANKTLYASVFTTDASASYTLNIYDNHLTADGPSRTRRTLNSAVYFTFDAVAGQAYNITVTPTSGDPTLSVYSGTTTAFLGGLIPDSTTLIGTSNNLGTQTESITFVASATQTYYIEVDNANTSVEMDFSTSVQKTTASADLQVSIDSLSYSGGNLTINYTVSNTGVAYSAPVNLGFWLNSTTAPDPATQPYDAQVTVGGVAPGASTSGTTSINAGTVTAGTLWAYVDPENTLPESNETNNVSAGRTWAAPVTAPQSFDFENAIMPTAMASSGDVNWSIVVGGANSSAYSIRSGTETANQSGCTEIAVTGAVNMSFDWKALTDYSTDYLRFYVDGWIQTTYSGADTWQTYNFSPYSTGLHTYKWCYEKGAADNVAVDDGGWIDNVVFQPELPDLTVALSSAISDGTNLTINYTISNNSTAASAATTLDLWANLASAPTMGSTGDVQVSIPVIAGGATLSGSTTVPSTATSGAAYAIIDSQNVVAENNESNNVSSGYSWAMPVTAPQTFDFESGIMPAAMVSSGNAGWQIDSTTANGGTYSMRAAPITNSQTACTSVTASNSLGISFDWKVSSESGYDYLHFYIDDIEHGSAISGTTSWSNLGFLFASPATHVYKWCYTKDSSVSQGSDTGWVDNIRIM